jgi:hypothetical protein
MVPGESGGRPRLFLLCDLGQIVPPSLGLSSRISLISTILCLFRMSQAQYYKAWGLFSVVNAVWSRTANIGPRGRR